MGFNSAFKGLIQHLVSSLSVSDRPVLCSSVLKIHPPYRKMFNAQCNSDHHHHYHHHRRHHHHHHHHHHHTIIDWLRREPES
jgi:hypothetical protein